MGSSHSIRATHFKHPSQETSSSVETLSEEECDERHISISNKMVERLVEDATLAGGAAAAAPPVTPRGDYRDKIFMEKLKCLDENHSERSGMTLNDLNATATRIEMRTANMVSLEPVCADCKERVIDCYNNHESSADIVQCWNAVGEFSKCVSEAAAARLRARTQKDARDHARRTRHIAHAREHALRDLASTSLFD